MAAVWERKIVVNMGDIVLVMVEVDGDTAYPTGGYPIPDEYRSHGTLFTGTLEPSAVNQKGYVDSVNRKLVLDNGAGAQAANGSDQSARTDMKVSLFYKRR